MRYEAKLYVGKRSWGKGMRIAWGHPFAIWDNSANAWWKGAKTGRVTYANWETAQHRAKTLNDGTWESKYVPKAPDEYPATEFFRFLYKGQPSSDWAVMRNDVDVRTSYPYEEGSGTHVYDDYYNEVDRFYNEDISGWPSSPEIVPRDDWTLELRIVSQSDAFGEIVYENRIVDMEDWLLERLGIHATLETVYDHETRQKISEEREGWTPDLKVNILAMEPGDF